MQALELDKLSRSNKDELECNLILHGIYCMIFLQFRYLHFIISQHGWFLKIKVLLEVA